MLKKVLLGISIMLVAGFVLSACAPAASPAAEEPAVEEPAAEEPAAEEPAAEAEAEPVTISWWHISTKDPTLSDWQKMADDFMAENPNVTIEITVLENEAFKTKLATVLQSGEVPDIFQSWGGGGFAEYVEAGLLQDITPALDADGGAWRDTFGAGPLGVWSVDGKNYGVPWDLGIVGVWYNEDAFAEAGIETVPTTWSEFLADVQLLKDAGYAPISIGEADTWMGMHIWSYLALRIGGKAAMDGLVDGSVTFEDAPFVQAGEELVKLVDMGAFQDGFLGMVHDDAQGYFGNGKAGMLIGGQWTPSVQMANSASGEGLANMSMFNFPAIEGGAGNVNELIGGGNGFAIGKDAPPEAIEFVKYLVSADNQAIIAASGSGVPVVKGGEVGLTDPYMPLVADALSNASYFALYLDQMLPSAIGGVINDAVAKLYAGTATPEEVCAEIQAEWALLQ